MPWELDPMLLRASRQGLDLFLSENRTPFLKGRGRLEPITSGEFIERDTLYPLLKSQMDSKARDAWTRQGCCRFRWQSAIGNFRVDLGRESQGLMAMFRPVLSKLPTLDVLKVPVGVKSLLALRSGLILFCGPGSSGITTLSAAFTSALCEATALRVRILDADPEWLVPAGKSFLVRGVPNQNLMGDIQSSLSAGTDLFVFGDIVAPQIEEVLTACSSGALVLANMRASSSVHALERVLTENSALVRVLRAVVFCHLLPSENADELIPVWDVLLGNRAVIQALESQELQKLPQIQKSYSNEGMQNLDESLSLLVSQSRISKKDAKMWAHEPQRFES